MATCLRISARSRRLYAALSCGLHLTLSRQLATHPSILQAQLVAKRFALGVGGGSVGMNPGYPPISLASRCFDLCTCRSISSFLHFRRCTRSLSSCEPDGRLVLLSEPSTCPNSRFCISSVLVVSTSGRSHLRT